MKESFLILFFIFISYVKGYTKLSKYSSVSVKPKEKVYLDISGFETGELISLEFKMDLFFASSSEQDHYKLQIDQVAASNYYDSYYWGNLRTVTNRNVTKYSSDDYVFTWEEIKKEGKNYIFIIPHEPFSDFYSFWGNKIKIVNTGGLSAGEIAGIVIGIVVPLIVIGIIIFCCCCRNKSNSIYINTTSNKNQPLYPQPVYQQPTYQQPVYQQPAYQQPAYQDPSYNSTDFQQPAYQQPAYQDPSYNSTDYQQPVYQK